MQRDNRNTYNQPKRPMPAQAARTSVSPSRAASPQAKQAATSQAGGAARPTGKTSTSKTAKKKKQPKDRLGQAVVSMIFGIFGILLLIASLMRMSFESQYYYTFSPGAFLLLIFTFILNLVGFILGIRAKRSPRGSGMAIAGITLTALPVVGLGLFLIAGLSYTLLLYR